MMCAMRTPWSIAATLVLVLSVSAFAQVKKAEVPGITNFSRVDATVGCGGATAPAAMAGLKKEGLVSVLNLRLAPGSGGREGAGRAAAQAPRLQDHALALE